MPQTEIGDTLHTYIHTYIYTYIHTYIHTYILYCIAPPWGLFYHTRILKYEVTKKKENRKKQYFSKYDDSSFNKFKNERAQYVEVLESEIQR